MIALCLIVMQWPALFRAQCPVATVPYFEGFSSITANNQLPACWAASNLGGSCLSFAAPLNCAAFQYSPAGTSYFFTNSIQLNAGVNYSVTLWYRANAGAPGNWSNLSILMGTNSSSVGLSNLGSTSGIITNSVYAPLTATFNVAASGIYYFSISATGQPTANAQFLYWDDLEITIPCSINPVNLNATSSHSVLCAGDCATLSATGANTYFWSNGTIGQTVVICPTASLIRPNMPESTQSMSSFSVVYEVVGSNTLTNCTATASIYMPVNPKPQVQAIANPTVVCYAQVSYLQAFGASSYTWSGGHTGNVFLVTPTQNTGYSVIGENSFGCKDTAYVTLNVDPCLGISSNEMSGDVAVFPNPTQNDLTVRVLSGSSFSLSLYDLCGKKQYENTSEQGEINLSLEDFSSGYYLMKLEWDGKTSWMKVLKN